MSTQDENSTPRTEAETANAQTSVPVRNEDSRAEASAPDEQATPVEDQPSEQAPQATSAYTQQASSDTSTYEERSTSTSSSRQARERYDSGSTTGRDRLAGTFSMVGLACLLGGLGLAAAASAAPGLTQPVEAFGNPTVFGVVFAVAGTLLYGLGRMRHALSAVQHSVAGVREKTDLIEDVANEGYELRYEVGEFASETSALREDVAALHKRLIELTEVAANPEIQVSIFQLAAAQDKLAMRLDTAVKQRFETLQREVAERLESTANVQREMGSKVAELGERADEQRAAHEVKLERLLASIQTASQERDMRLDEVQDRLRSDSQDLKGAVDALDERLVGLAESRRQAEEEAAKGVEHLREHVDGRFNSNQQAFGDGLEQVRAGLEQRLEQLEGEHGRTLDAVAQTLRSGADEDAGLQLKKLEDVSTLLSEMQVEVREAHCELQAELVSELEALSARHVESWIELRSGIDELSARLEQQLQSLEGANTGRHEELTRVLADDRTQRESAWTDAVSSLEESTRSTGQKLADDATETALRIEQLLEDQTQTLGNSLRTSIQASEQVSAHLERGLSELTEQLAQVATNGQDDPPLALDEDRGQLFCETMADDSEPLEVPEEPPLAELEAVDTNTEEPLDADRDLNAGVLEGTWSSGQSDTEDVDHEVHEDRDVSAPQDPATPQEVGQEEGPPAALPRRWEAGEVDEGARGSHGFGVWIDSHADRVRFDSPPDVSSTPPPDRSHEDESDGR